MDAVNNIVAVGASSLALFVLGYFAQAGTPAPADPANPASWSAGGVTSLISQLAGGGLAFWLVYHFVTKMIPDHNARCDKKDADFLAALNAMRESNEKTCRFQKLQ